MQRQESVAVIGAGVIGCAVAYALAREGRRVLLLDRAEPASAGASFGNVGHIATEQLEPLPSRELLLGFWRELFLLDGPLDIPPRRIVALSPWIVRFAAAAFRQHANTEPLAALVRQSANSLASFLAEMGRSDLLRRHGHHAVWLGTGARERASREASKASQLGVHTVSSPADLLGSIAVTASATSVAGLWYPESAHVLDPAAVARTFASAAVGRGATVQRCEVRQLGLDGHRIMIQTDSNSLSVSTAVVCAGAWSAPFLAPFGLRAPLEAERGYHVELPNHPPLIDAPVYYADRRVVVTPMAGRLRCSSYLEFAGLEAPPDLRKARRLRAKLRELGYRCEPEGPSWMGPRPTLPDYLPGIGRAAGTPGLLYAVGHQHLGLTLAGPTAEVIADLAAQRNPRVDIAAFDLRRFGAVASA